MERIIKKAVEVFRRADRLCPSVSQSSTQIEEVCRQLGIAEQTFYAWKKQWD